MLAAIIAVAVALACPALAADPIVLGLPLDCEVGETCAVQQYVDHDASPAARDYHCGTLSYDGHNGTDFRLPTMAAQRAGVNVLAAADGVVARVRGDMAEHAAGAAAGAVTADSRMCGNGVVITHPDGWETQYCHMAKDSVRVEPGERVSAGTPIGRVGLSGATVFPHLHFTVRHQGAIVDPFAFQAAADSCGGGTPLWRPALRASLAYRARSVLNAAFAANAVSMEAVEAGTIDTPTNEAGGPEAMVAYVRSIGLKRGDVQGLLIEAPDGSVLVDHVAKALDRHEAQSLLFVGKRRPPAGWPFGRYRATYRVLADGQPVLEKSFSLMLAPRPGP